MLLLTHIVFSLFLGILISNNPYFIILLMFASILPDFDMHVPFVRHRGIFHSIFAGALVGLLFLPFSFQLAFAFFLGYCMHLLADSLTKAGVKPFWPHPYRTKFGFITTGGISEKVFFVLILGFLAVKVLYILN